MKTSYNRRQFLRTSGCAALGTSTLFSSLLNLNAMNASAMNSSAILDCSDYKSLVCIFFSGGCDSFNKLIPTSNDEYQNYTNIRANLAISKDTLLGLNTTNTPGRTFGLHPSMPRLQQLFNSGKAAFVSNVGTLVTPITKEGLYNGTANVPLGLFSHSDQQKHWQTGIPHERAAVGWGGKMADLLQSCNTNTNLSMNISLSGSNLFQTGNSVVDYSITPEGAAGINDDNDDWLLNSIRKMATTNIVDATYQDVFKKSYANTIRTARIGSEQFNTALANSPEYVVPFSNNPISIYNNLAQNLKMVANIIAAREQLGMKRQIFFVEYTGWDHHDELLDIQSQMLAEVDDALYSFDAALDQLGVSNQVTTFTISDFGRTLTSNGNGTDHGWGGNVMVMGGAVNGSKIYGTYPELILDSSIEIGGGVFIPTTAADQYFAEIALWYGMPESSLVDLFPNIGNFYSIGSGNPMGFLNI